MCLWTSLANCPKNAIMYKTFLLVIADKIRARKPAIRLIIICVDKTAKGSKQHQRAGLGSALPVLHCDTIWNSIYNAEPNPAPWDNLWTGRSLAKGHKHMRPRRLNVSSCPGCSALIGCIVCWWISWIRFSVVHFAQSSLTQFSLLSLADRPQHMMHQLELMWLCEHM